MLEDLVHQTEHARTLERSGYLQILYGKRGSRIDSHIESCRFSSQRHQETFIGSQCGRSEDTTRNEWRDKICCYDETREQPT